MNKFKRKLTKKLVDEDKVQQNKWRTKLTNQRISEDVNYNTFTPKYRQGGQGSYAFAHTIDQPTPEQYLYSANEFASQEETPKNKFVNKASRNISWARQKTDLPAGIHLNRYSIQKYT